MIDEMEMERQRELAEEKVWDALESSYKVASRPQAEKKWVRFDELKIGDFITADGIRWAKVIKFEGPHCNIKTRQIRRPPEGSMAVLFEIPEAVTVSGETHYWIDRKPDEQVRIDSSARRST